MMLKFQILTMFIKWFYFVTNVQMSIVLSPDILGVWDRRLELVVGFEPENAGRHVRLSAQHL
jgi:hypothetical protein